MPKRIGVLVSAPSLFAVAREAYEDLKRPANDPRGRQSAGVAGLTALVFAAASIEALVNELAELASLSLSGGEDLELHAFVDVVNEIERARGSTPLKLILVSRVLGQPYDKGAQPWQDYTLLRSLRDAIMHLKPVKIFDDEGQTLMGTEGVRKALESRDLLKPVPPGYVSSFLADISEEQVVRWALNAAVAMAQSLLAMLPEDFRVEIEGDYLPVFTPVGESG